MANFKTAFDRTIGFEGDWSGEPEDNGNWTSGKRGVGQLIGTRWGITAWEYKDYLGRIPTVDEMKQMPISVAEKIYKNKYWDKVRGDEILDQDIANNIYDMAINSGFSQGVILAQRALGIKETGKMDDITLNKLNNK